MGIAPSTGYQNSLLIFQKKGKKTVTFRIVLRNVRRANQTYLYKIENLDRVLADFCSKKTDFSCFLSVWRLEILFTEHFCQGFDLSWREINSLKYKLDYFAF